MVELLAFVGFVRNERQAYALIEHGAAGMEGYPNAQRFSEWAELWPQLNEM
jgi:hypothetical protein